jgi:hypothetical protein
MYAFSADSVRGKDQNIIKLVLRKCVTTQFWGWKIMHNGQNKFYGLQVLTSHLSIFMRYQVVMNYAMKSCTMLHIECLSAWK